jgi:prepilin-type N-terminal cleavage/methylation domain-containing protein
MHRLDSARRASPVPFGNAFTLVEVMVVLGIVAILTSFALPGLGRAMEEARLARTASIVRQDAALIQLFAADHRDEYPCWGRSDDGAQE